MARWFVLATLVLSACSSATYSGRSTLAESASSDEIFSKAFEERTSDLQVEGSGVVSRILSDDIEEPRHQRFVVQLDSGQTLLIVHNIDLAARAKGLRKGDRVTFRGEYEWDEQGGVVHWTHRDPASRHEDGWIRHRGQTYQ